MILHFKGKKTELIQNGSEIRVDNNNKEEFVKLRSLYHMISAIRKQVDAFCDGFDEIKRNISHEFYNMTLKLIFYQRLQKFLKQYDLEYVSNKSFNNDFIFYMNNGIFNEPNYYKKNKYQFTSTRYQQRVL